MAASDMHPAHSRFVPDRKAVPPAMPNHGFTMFAKPCLTMSCEDEPMVGQELHLVRRSRRALWLSAIGAAFIALAAAGGPPLV